MGQSDAGLVEPGGLLPPIGARFTPTAIPTNTSVPPTATLAINPVGGAFEQSVVLNGAGFGPHEVANVVAGASGTVIYSATTTLAGTFALTSTVRQDPYGPVTLTAIGRATARRASTLFFISLRLCLARERRCQELVTYSVAYASAHTRRPEHTGHRAVCCWATRPRIAWAPSRAGRRSPSQRR